MVHQQGHSQHHILRIHPNYFVARTKIHTHIGNSDTLDASGNMIHQQVESEPRLSLAPVYFDQQGRQEQPPPH
ncbi:hypothetical protein Hanom_Chr16g01421981 [Helianthus anomalus]